MTQPAPGTRSLAILLAAPLLVVGALTVGLVSNSLMMIGPFDRAQVGWGVAVPMFILAPGAAALTGRWFGGRVAASIVAGISTALGGLTILGLLLTMPRIGCAPVSPLEALPNAVVVGIVAGLGFAIPAAVAWAARDRGPVVALAVGAVLAFGAIFLTIIAWAVTFVVGVSCAYVPPG